MNTQFQNHVKSIMDNQAPVVASQVVRKQDGSIEISASYFNASGYSAEEYAVGVQKALTSYGVRCTTTGRTDDKAHRCYTAIVKEA